MIIIDAGIQNIKIKIFSKDGKSDKYIILKSEDEISELFTKNKIFEEIKTITGNKIPKKVFITGKLSKTIKKILPNGEEISSVAALWMVGKKIINENNKFENLGILEISASGYTGITLDRNGEIFKDNIFINPHCGAGSGINISRILQKLGIEKDALDEVLNIYLGDKGFEKRKLVSIRADRCGVFASSATISDKNQGIPLENALAVTVKSEVLKACKKFVKGVDIIVLTGGIFKWKYARDCAEDYFKENGTKKFIYDENNDLTILGIEQLDKKLGHNFKKSEEIIEQKGSSLLEYPSFIELSKIYIKDNIYKRDVKDKELISLKDADLKVNIGLDVGSTMAKIVVSDDKDNILFLNSYSNYGDTIETIKYIFKDLKESVFNNILVQNIGITGSGRYQVQKVLREIYPHLSKNINVLVENYAHARGSIREAKDRIKFLKTQGHEINEELCILVDVGGEDTKVSVISLKDGDLLDNAMNLKCSAGTGSLMDTLKSLFGIEDIKEACDMAFNAKKAYDINATCAVFLMENAKILQADGISKSEILASSYWAIVENMARTLWSQVNFPKNCLVLLHGQTMLSDPLPLAIVKRLKDVLDSNVYGYVPSDPGHRACFGLINSFSDKSLINEKFNLDLLIEKSFEKKLFVCRGAVCGDKNASCNRSMLNFMKSDGKSGFIMLGGCGPVNEEKKSLDNKMDDYYKTTIKSIQNKFFPHSEDKNRIIVPRSFAVSEYAYFFSKIFTYYDIEVCIDDVKKDDILLAQPYLNIDTCAPNVGATGQLIRLSDQDHKYILIPQIEFLDTSDASLGRTCTVNQGGILSAMLYGKNHNPDANFFVFDIKMDKFQGEYIAAQIFERFLKILNSYGINTDIKDFKKAVDLAIESHNKIKIEFENALIPLLENAINKGIDIIIIAGREYVLNPGVYDSHAGKLFNEKGVLVIPSYVLNIELSNDFNYVYWRNPHYILSLVNGVKNRELYKIIKNTELKTLFKKIENKETKSSLGISLVSTFKCGPDTVNLPFIQEVTKKVPFLTIQSDAAINELAHLENRVNTYMKQLTDDINKNSVEIEDFKISYLDSYSSNLLNKETDVIYFPTLNDNRYIVAVMRASGYTCIDNYDDETYNLEKIIRNGRKYVGDSVCAPLSGVFSDSIDAVKDFIKRKKDGELKGKKRIFIFDNAGDGPCRQGQYYMVHKLYMHKELPNIFNNSNNSFGIENNIVKFLVGEEKYGYSVGIDEWGMVQAFQAFVVQGVMHSVYMKYGTNCETKEEFNKFLIDYKELKNKLFDLFEKSAPSDIKLKLTKYSKFFGIENLIKYFSYGLYNNNGIRKELVKFRKKWEGNKNNNKKIKVYVDGEAYMRVAQIDMIYEVVVNSLGLRKFEIGYSPLWTYFEYLLESKILVINEENQVYKQFIENFSKNDDNLIKKYKHNKKLIKQINKLSFILRTVFINPLYKSAGIDIPEKMDYIFKKSKRIIPTSKPDGELIMYVGEVISKLENGTDLFLNISPEGCMVSTMGEILSPIILKETEKNRKTNSRIETLLSQYGEIDEEKIKLALLKIMGPEKFYSDK